VEDRTAVSPHDFVQRLEAMAAAIDDEGVVALAREHYSSVAARLTADERRAVGSILHASRMALAMKEVATSTSSGDAVEGRSTSSSQEVPVPR
jgi:hypothetical protein